MIYEENGKIIVDELRPMSEAPLSNSFLAVTKLGEITKLVYWDDDCWSAAMDNGRYDYDDFLGWIPRPEYRRKEEKLIPYNFNLIPTFKFSDLPMGGLNPPGSARVSDRDNQIFNYNGTEWVISPINELIHDKRDLINAIHNRNKE